MSEKALELLSKSTFKEGLVSGTLDGVAVAHKFGERTNQLQDGTDLNKELHDCGIIYYPGDPYLLCVMTRGSDFPKLQSAISTVSHLAYGYINSQH